MGFFSFIKEAGEKITDQKDELHEDRLVKIIERKGLKIEDVEIEIEDGKATVKGNVEDRVTKEKIVLIIGNSIGIGEVDDQITIQGQEVEDEEDEAKKTQLHTVVRGDTLSGIAKQFYGNAMKYPVIFEANKPMLKDPNKIYPGQVLRIPPLED